MQADFQYILNNYKNAPRRIDKNNDLYKILITTIPNKLSSILNRKDLKIYGRMGTGNTTSCPWVAILNTKITSGAQYGLYVVYLFRKDMKGFYLSLNQGITNFKRNYPDDPYEAARKVAKYFQDELSNSSFSKNDISLGVRKSELGYGYEQTNILSKYYESNKFSYEELKNDLLKIMQDYDEISDSCQTINYDKVISNVMGYEESRLVAANDAVQSIKETLESEGLSQTDINKSLVEVEPFSERTGRFSRITNPISKKVDYIKKAKYDAINGAQGEQLAIDFEQEKLRKAGRPDLAEKVKWDSKTNDALGYDIVSYEIDKNGEEREIKIEVKTTEAKKDCKFFISRNEVETSKQYKNNYCLFRIYDLKSANPKFYRVFGQIEENFDLDPYTYLAFIKQK